MTGLCLFDCDGTLVDSAHTIVTAMGRAFTACGLDTPPAAAVRAVIGLSLREALARLLADGEGADRVEPLAGAYAAAFGDLARHRPAAEPLYPGVEATLARLSENGWWLGVATGKSRRGAFATLGAHGLLERFATVQTADDGAGKPAPEMVLNAMRETGMPRERTVVVGDTVYDMAMARNARVRALGVAWGYNATDQLRAAGAEIVVEAFTDIPAVLDGWFGA